jgi:hypothetical protein
MTARTSRSRTRAQMQVYKSEPPRRLVRRS